MDRKKYNKLSLIFLFFISFIIFSVVPQVNATSYFYSFTTSNVTSGTGYRLVIDTGNFNVYNEGEESDDTSFLAYKIIDVFFNSSSNEVKYQFTSDFQAYLTSTSVYRGLTIDSFMNMRSSTAQSTQKYSHYNTSDYVVSGGYLSNDAFTTLMGGYATYIKKNKISSTINIADESRLGNGIPFKKSTSVPIGTYLILPISPKYVYGVMVDSIKVSYSNSYWRVDDASVVAKKSEHTIASVFSQGGESGNEISVSCHKAITGKVTIALPNYPANASNKELSVNISASDGNINLYQISGMSLSNNNNGVNGASIVKNGVTVGEVLKIGDEVIFNFNDISMLGTTVEITYPALPLDSSTAVIGGSGNSRTVSMKLSDPYRSSSDADVHTVVTSKLYTYALQITGTAGAGFQILDNSNNVIGNVTISSDGIGVYKGLQTGTYKVKQITPPGGFALIPGEQTVKVGSGGTAVSGKSGYYGITIKNTVLAALPYTGSTGSIIFVISGLIIATSSVVFIIIIRKRTKIAR